LKAAGALAAAAGLAVGCDTPPEATVVTDVPNPQPSPQPPVPATTRHPHNVTGQYPEVPDTPTEPPQSGALYFFTLSEARTVEALTATVFPGTPDDPGAREAGVVNYIDYLLSHEHGFAQPIYREPPFAEAYEGDTPPG
jgi:hypothetical protein